MLHLNIIKVKTPEEMGKAAADEFEAVIHAKPACVIGLATGSPSGTMVFSGLMEIWSNRFSCMNRR